LAPPATPKARPPPLAPNAGAPAANPPFALGNPAEAANPPAGAEKAFAGPPAAATALPPPNETLVFGVAVGCCPFAELPKLLLLLLLFHAAPLLLPPNEFVPAAAAGGAVADLPNGLLLFGAVALLLPPNGFGSAAPAAGWAVLPKPFVPPAGVVVDEVPNVIGVDDVPPWLSLAKDEAAGWGAVVAAAAPNPLPDDPKVADGALLVGAAAGAKPLKDLLLLSVGAAAAAAANPLEDWVLLLLLIGTAATDPAPN